MTEFSANAETAANSALQIRVYYEDTDAGGVVYHANYARFFERARTEYLRRIGFSHEELREKFGVFFVVRTMKMEFLRPAVLDDLLLADARPVSHGRVYADFVQTARRAEDNETVAMAEVRVVCVSAESKRAVSIPPPLADTMDENVG